MWVFGSHADAAGPETVGSWPIIQMPFDLAWGGDWRPDRLGVTLAYYVHGGATFGDVETQLRYERVLTLPEKPVIFYAIDSGEVGRWPTVLPAWIRQGRTWFSPQLYRGLGESMAGCASRWRALMALVASYGLGLCPTIQCYDRVTMPVSEVLETWDTLVGLLRQYESQIRGWLPFGYGRPGGLVTHPELYAVAADLMLAVPGRLNTCDGGLADAAADRRANLRRKIRYSTPLLDPWDVATREGLIDA